jgi:two-component system sensor histidine kinase CpxA
MRIRVRSIFTKIVFWFTATFALSLVGYVVTSMLLFARLAAREPIFPGMHWHLLEDARDAYEKRGAPGLGDYLAQLNSYSRTERFLVDSRGRDLVTGEDRSSLLAQRAARSLGRRWLPGFLRIARFVGREGPVVLVHSSSDRRYRLISVFRGQTRSEALESLAYFLWLPLLIGVFCYVLAVHLASPLRGLRRAMEKFGRGDLGVRYHLSRRDEIGEVAQAFNRMADQITTLLAAERRLLQDVSHELRSPLARLGFAVELARISPDREAAMNRIRKEADRLNNLVDELLQLTRAEGDPGARNLEDVDLARLLGELVADCALEADAAGCRLTLCGERSVVITGERELLRRACDNVLRNAIHHAPPGSAVEIELSRRDDRAEIDIRDRGTGVPRDALGAIFEPFFRVESDRGRSSGGVGLGLAIARRAVELHQGQITAFNADPGLVVAIELPCGGEPGTIRQPGVADGKARA